MTELRELPTTIAQFVPKEFLMWLIETRTRINQKLTIIGSPTVNNVPVITASGELIDSAKEQPTGDFVGTSDVQTLTNKTLTTPTIASFVNATHNHEAAAGGGQIDEDALALTNVTTNNVSITKHGFCPIAPNDTAKYLRGDATWAKPLSWGTFTCAAAATTVVNDANVTANSVIVLTPTNAAGGTLMAGLTSLYISAKAAGVSFTVATANAAAAAGTETFNYLVAN